MKSRAIGLVISCMLLALSPARVRGENAWSHLFGAQGQAGSSWPGGASSIRQTTDGGYIVAGAQILDSQDVFVVRLDSTGGVIWQNIYGHANQELAKSVQQTSDGGFIVAGTKFILEGAAFWVLRLDPTGEVLWQKTFTLGGQDKAYEVYQTPDGGFVVVGDHGAVPPSSIVVIRLDPTGALLWGRSYINNLWFERASLHPTDDGGFVVAGAIYIPETHAMGGWVGKLDPQGAIQWQKRFGGEQSLSVYSVRPAKDGGYIWAGAVRRGEMFGNEAPLAVKLDGGGNILWQKIYAADYPKYMFPFSVIQATDGEYVMAGIMGAQTAFDSQHTDGWAMKLGPSGGITWQKAYGGYYFDGLEGASQAADGDILLAGSCLSWPFEGTYWAMKVDAAGGISPDCDFITDLTFQPADFCAVGVEGQVEVVEAPVTVADTTASPSPYDGIETYQCGYSSCTLQCTATATPGAGSPPLSVTFSADSTPSGCPGVAEYAWDFGDGETIWQKTVQHTYRRAGTYAWMSWAVINGVMCTQGGTVEVTTSCTLDCSATVPAECTVGTEVTFHAQAAPDLCTGTPQYLWDFGDNETSTLQNPTHIYALPTSYPWSVTVSVVEDYCVRTGTIAALGSGGASPGDCNRDGTVSIGEVQRIINMFLGIEPVACGADCSGDGQVSIGEVQRVTMVFLGAVWDCP